MAKHDERHLTTEQLSAYIDKQLSAQELAACEAHLQTCPQCQQELTGLRQTVALLRALPQPALPRSFTLPAGVSHLQRPVAPALPATSRPLRPPASQPVRQHYVRSSLRAVSIIAAVIGLFILLGGLLVSLPRGGGASMSSGTTNSAASTTPGPNVLAPRATSITPAASKKATVTIHAAAPVRTPASGVATQPSPVPGPGQGPAQSSLPLPDLTTPLGLQEVGFTLFVLGVVGVLLTRRRQRGRRGNGQTP